MSIQGITTNHLIHVDLLTKDYRVVGRVMVGNSGLVGLLGDPIKSFIEVRNAQIAYMQQPTRLVRRFNFVTVLRERIIAACIDRSDDNSPLSFPIRSPFSGARYPVYIAIHHYEINGLIEWSGRYTLSAFLADSRGKIVPAYNVTIGSSEIPGFCIETKAALINFANLDLIAEGVDEKAAAP